MPDLASSSFGSHRHIIAYWIATALVVFELALGGVWDILRVPQVRGLIERLGYPLYFLVILGIWKVLGAVALIIPRFPRLKEWAYAGVIFDLTGAVASLLASGLIDAGTVAYPIVMTGVAVASWALRPPSRRLGPCKRLRQWLCAKHKVMSGTKRFSEASLYDVLGLVRLTKRTRTLPWATS